MLAIAGCFLIAACGSRVRYPKGGYAYAKHLEENDTEFYFVPLRNKESRRDSLHDAGSFGFWRSIDEPNLSLRPRETDVFRFAYSEALNPTLYIIRLMPSEMIVRIGTA